MSKQWFILGLTLCGISCSFNCVSSPVETKAKKAPITIPSKIHVAQSSNSGLVNRADSTVNSKKDSNKYASIYDLSLEELLKLKPIKVTARKRTEAIQDIPASISVIDQQQIQTYASAAKDIRFLSARSPSLLIESSFDRLFPRFYLRGLGNTDFDINASQPVSVVLDGVVQENPMLRGFPMFDMQRIEVLRGPQGTLFGRNTPAGVIKLETIRPKPETSSSAALTVGNHQTVDFRGMLNAQLSTNLTSRLSVTMQKRDNWIDNAAPNFEQTNILGGFDEKSARIQFNYITNEQLNLLFNYHYRNFEANPAVFRANILNSGSNRLNENFVEGVVYLDAAERTSQTLTNHGGSFTLDYQFDELLLTAITGYESVKIYSVGDVDGGYGASFTATSGPGNIAFPAENASHIPKHQQLTQEIRWSTAEHNDVNYQFGIFVFNENLLVESFSFDTINGGVLNGFSDQRQKTNAWAVYGTLDYDLTEKMKVTTGVRYGLDKKNYTTERFLSPIGAGPLSPIEVNKSDHHLSWDISTVYQWEQNTNLYFRLAKAFRAPSIQGRLTFSNHVTTAKSENVISIETGIKQTFLDDQARVNITAFSYRIKDQQITAVGGETNSNRLLNADDTASYGLELETELVFGHHWRLNAGLSYNNSKINDEELSVSICSQCTVTDPINANGFARIDGNNLPHSPEWIYHLIANYESELSAGEVYFQTDWSYRSEVDFFLYHSEEFVGPSLLEGGLKLGYRWSSQDFHYDIALLGRNITNQQEIIGGVDFNNLTGIVNEPRFFGVEFKASF